MAEAVFEYGSKVELDVPAVATGHVATRMAWEDGPNGKRRPGSTPELDEHGRPQHILDALLPLGRDGQLLVFGVTVTSHEVPAPAALQPVEFDGLRVKVRQHKSGRGVEVSFSADAVRPAGGPTSKPVKREGEAA